MSRAPAQLDLFGFEPDKDRAQRELLELAKNRNVLQADIDNAATPGLKRMFEQALLNNRKRAAELYMIAFPRPSPQEIQRMKDREAHRKQPWYRGLRHGGHHK